jgi:hypothetical protein
MLYDRCGAVNIAATPSVGVARPRPKLGRRLKMLSMYRKEQGNRKEQAVHLGIDSSQIETLLFQLKLFV